MIKENIIITGGSGLLAANWAIAMKHRYAVILGMHTRAIRIENVDSRVIDLNSVDSIAAVLSDTNATIVVHCAAFTNVDDCELQPQIARYANIDIARNVATACSAHGAKLVHISTDHVFSGSTSLMDESAAIGPLNVYAKSKAAGEVAVLEECPTAIIARTNFFGWGLPYRKSFSDTIIETLRDSREIELFSDAYFTPILMEQLIIAVHNLLDIGAKGIFHIVGDERLSKFQFGLSIASVFGLDAAFIKPTLLAERTDLALRPLDLSLDNHKLCSTIGRNIGDVKSQLARLFEQESLKPLNGCHR